MLGVNEKGQDWNEFKVLEGVVHPRETRVNVIWI